MDQGAPHRLAAAVGAVVAAVGTVVAAAVAVADSKR